MNGAELWVKRRILGMTPSELGDLLDVNPRTITRWEQKRETIPVDLADRIDGHVDDHLNLVHDIWARFLSGEHGTSPVGLTLMNRQEDLPDWVPLGTNPEAWNHAVATVYRESMEATDLDVEWHRFLENDLDGQ